MEIFEQLDLSDLVRRALAEDVGQGDITTAATVRSGQLGKARITVKEAEGIVFCGGPVLEAVFALSGVNPKRFSVANEGERLSCGDIVAEIEGGLAGLLIGERTALNFVQLMSGIATMTRRYVDAVAGTRARIIDTRKTHPGLRIIEKYAVRIGGGSNHRFGLDSGVLIKENHIAAAGSITKAVESARALAPHTLRIEVECESLAQVEEARRANVDVVLLDNMSADEMRQARALAGEGIILEASGGITLANVRDVAETGVDLISIGALTHSPKAADLSMRIEAE